LKSTETAWSASLSGPKYVFQQFRLVEEH